MPPIPQSHSHDRENDDDDHVYPDVRCYSQGVSTGGTFESEEIGAKECLHLIRRAWVRKKACRPQLLTATNVAGRNMDDTNATTFMDLVSLVDL
jgi:hypothetical protein